MARYADTPEVDAEITVAAAPPVVWELVTDIGLMAELSGELQEVHWLDDADRAAPGARFRGRNVHPAVGEWWTTSQVVECTAPEVFAWAVGDPECPMATWRFTLRADGGGTVLRQSARLGPGRSNVNTAIDRAPEREEGIVAHRLREFRTGIESNLAALRDLAEGSRRRPG